MRFIANDWRSKDGFNEYSIFYSENELRNKILPRKQNRVLHLRRYVEAA